MNHRLLPNIKHTRTHTPTHKPGCVHTRRCKNKGPRSHFIKNVPYPDAQYHSGCISCTPLHRSALSSAQAPFSALCQTNTKIIIICTLSPISAHTSNFPRLIQARTPRTSVRYNWRRRGPAETSIKGSWLSKVPLCVLRSGLSVALLSELPVECSLHPVHSEWLLFHSACLRTRPRRCARVVAQVNFNYCLLT